MRSVASLIATLAIIFVLSTPAIVPAASSGLAWDSVSKIASDPQAATLQPGNFASDYAAAAAAPTPASGGGGMFNKMKQAVANAKGAMQMFGTGIAEKHYVAGSKERTDNVAMQTATITDCSARTITTLDLKKKTYHVVSMDQPATKGSQGSSSTGTPGPAPTDDGTRIAIKVATKALGAKSVEGQQTNGFQSDTTFTETKPNGQSQTNSANIIAYYTGLSNPTPTCGLFRSSSDTTQGNAMMGGLTRMMQAFSSAGIDKRITVSQTGPHMPFGKLSMFDAATFAGESGRSVTFLSERGNVRSVDASDAAFSVPADFTKE